MFHAFHGGHGPLGRELLENPRLQKFPDPRRRAPQPLQPRRLDDDTGLDALQQRHFGRAQSLALEKHLRALALLGQPKTTSWGHQRIRRQHQPQGVLQGGLVVAGHKAGQRQLPLVDHGFAVEDLAQQQGRDALLGGLDGANHQPRDPPPRQRHDDAAAHKGRPMGRNCRRHRVGEHIEPGTRDRHPGVWRGGRRSRGIRRQNDRRRPSSFSTSVLQSMQWVAIGRARNRRSSISSPQATHSP